MEAEKNLFDALKSSVPSGQYPSSEQIGLIASTVLSEISLTAADMLRALIPQLMTIFRHPETDVSFTVIECLNKLIKVLTTQHERSVELSIAKESVLRVFIAEEFLTDLLMNIYRNLSLSLFFLSFLSFSLSLYILLVFFHYSFLSFSFFSSLSLFPSISNINISPDKCSFLLTFPLMLTMRMMLR